MFMDLLLTFGLIGSGVAATGFVFVAGVTETPFRVMFARKAR